MDTPFFGKIAKVNLTTKTFVIESFDKSLYPQIIGGKGLGVYLLLKNLNSNTEPLSPDNLIILANGPFTGSDFPSASRVELITKSPLTGTFLDTNAGGFLGKELKGTGLDAIIISGKSDELVYLFIDDEKIQFREAKNLIGKSTVLTEKVIKYELQDEKVKVISIGVAGENQVLYADVCTGGRHFGRGGAGAVLGSKNLKAIAVRGRKNLPWNDDVKFKNVVQKCLQKISNNEMTGKGKSFPTLGTHITIEVSNFFGVFPTRNWQRGEAPEIDNHWPDDFSKVKVKSLGCTKCPIACKRLVKVMTDENGDVLHDGPEYESIYALGVSCGIFNATSVIYLDYLCTEYGLDSISTGVTISFVMECYEKGLITKTDLDGIELSFGNAEGASELIKKIAFKEGIGKLLSQGTKKVSEQIGQNSDYFAMTVKGMELPGYDPRGMKAMALLYATSDRGGCHVRGSTLRSEIFGITKKIDRFSYDGKALLVAELHKEYPLLNSLSICLFANFALNFDDYTEAINSLFNINYNSEDLLKNGSKIWQLTRLFNCREGFERKDDTLPRRLFLEPLPDGLSKGESIDEEKFQQMLGEYYLIQGWDRNGVPTQETLKSLGLTDII